MCWRAVVCLLVEFALRTAFRFGTEPYGFGFRSAAVDGLLSFSISFIQTATFGRHTSE